MGNISQKHIQLRACSSMVKKRTRENGHDQVVPKKLPKFFKNNIFEFKLAILYLNILKTNIFKMRYLQYFSKINYFQYINSYPFSQK